jgi:hypothetical protein
MKRFFFIVLVVGFIMTLTAVAPASAQFNVTCDNGAQFSNGVEFRVIQMRTGFSYTATAIGLNGFDPVLAVLNSAGTGLCSDDDPTAATYTANLPTTGQVSSSSLSSQVTFNNNGQSAFQDISLVVGGFGDQAGEFILILEGMAVTSDDSQGDPFSVNISPQMVASGVPITAYMISKTTDLDSLIYLIDENRTPLIVEGTTDTLYGCDDAGTQSCWGDSTELSNSFVSTEAGSLPGYQFDAMLSLPLSNVQLSSDYNQNFYTFLMTSYQQSTLGQYVVAFHVGTAGAAGDGTTANTNTNQLVQATPVPQQNFGSLPQGMSVTCDNGAQFDNGVEVQVIQMRAGFTYTATAVGINGFDPVLAVLNPDGTGLCSDDTAAASRYAVNLPTTGSLLASNLSSQVTFNHNDPSGFSDVSLVIGGFGNASGEFVLILEGMAVTAEDNVGDPLAVNVTPGMVNSGVPLTVYMISKTTDLDPLIYQVDPSFNLIPVPGSTDAYYGCDDAGTQSCSGDSTELSNFFVGTANGNLPGYQYDAMYSLPLTDVQLNSSREENYFFFLMTSYQQNTLGQYVMAFHMATAGSASV